MMFVDGGNEAKVTSRFRPFFSLPARAAARVNSSPSSDPSVDPRWGHSLNSRQPSAMEQQVGLLRYQSYDLSSPLLLLLVRLVIA